MQIELKKYFMIIRSPAVDAAPVGKRRGTLTTSRELSALARRRTHCLCPKNLNITALFQCTPKCAPNSAAFIRRFLSVMFDQFCTYLENLTIHNEERARRHAITLGNRRGAQTTHKRASKMGGATIGEWEGENLQHIGSCIQTWDDEFVQIFDGNHLL